MVDLNEMLAFARVVARGSFSAAAREMGVPPSTLSRKVASLERRLDTRLLERTTRRLHLTETGALYYDRCRTIAQLVDEADDEVENLARSPRGLLRITAPTVLGQLYLGPLVTEYLSRYPDVRVEVVLAGRAMDLVAEGFDVGIRLVATEIVDSSLLMRRLGASTPMLCASPTYLASRGEPRSLQDLANHPIIGLGRVRPQFTWRFLDERGDTIPLPLEPRVQVNSTWLAREICRAGLGIALLPSFLADPDLASGLLTHVLPELAARSLDVCVVFPQSSRRSAKVRAFLEILYDYFTPGRPWR